MKTRIEDAQALGAISPQAMIAYATAEGWHVAEDFGAHSQVYIKGNQEIIIPGTSRLADYTSVVSDIINSLSNIEQRDEVQIYRDLSTSDKDVVRVRIPDAEANGSIFIGSGVDLVVHARDMLLSAACSAWSPKASYRAGKVNAANDYLNRVRLGQTEQGSFVVTLLAPVPPAFRGQAGERDVETQEPFDRRVTRKLTTGLDAAANAIERFNLGAGPAVFESAIQRGLSANLCEAVANLDRREGSVDISVTWARTRPTLSPRWSRCFTQADGAMMLEVARIFRERHSRPDEQLEGFITKLAREDGERTGTVSMKSLIDGRYTSVKVELRHDDYDKAIQAHKGRHPISMSGTLVRVGSRWWLNNAADVFVVYDDEEAEESDGGEAAD